MLIDEFNFTLPKKLIAQTPASPRDSARLLVYDRSNANITDATFRDLPQFLNPKTTLVRNQAKVDKARLIFDNLEVFVLETYNDKTVKAMVRPGKKFKLGQTVELDRDVSAEVVAVDEHGHRTLNFSHSLDDKVFDAHRHTPLPPYIAQDESLANEYQTVYARDLGSKAAPTAGLHFTEKLLGDIAKRWPIVDVTLNVGLGTFAPIDEHNIRHKKLHAETYSISPASAAILNKSSHITAVGTTTVRVLESAFDNGFEALTNRSTDIFIQPDDKLQVVNSLITNFHLPSTSLLMMVAAFTGGDELMSIYQHAITKEYRFYSFGDAMLII